MTPDDEFKLWAFGGQTFAKYLMLENDTLDLILAWNDLHGEETGIWLEDLEDFRQMLPMMKVYWGNHITK